MDFINNHSWCRNNEGKKRLRKAEKMTNGRKTQGHQKEERTDEEKTERGKDIEHEICVVTRNVNKSSAQYDFSVTWLKIRPK